MNAGPRILIIGINQTLVWNVAQSLNLKGLKPIVLAAQYVAPLRLGFGCRKYVHWKTATLVGGELQTGALESVLEVCQKEQITMVLPADYESTLLLSASHDKSIPHCAIPDVATLKQLNDKWQLSLLLKRLAIPHPQSELIASSNEMLNTKLPFPIITKPVNQWASVGFEIHSTFGELNAKVAAQQLKSPFPLIAQTYSSGYDVGLSCIAEHGKIVAYCMFHANKKRTRSFFDDPRFLAIIQKIVSETQYHGIGNWDAIYNPIKNDYQILELNPRFWSSMLYTSNAGINFPYLMANPQIWNANAPFKAILGDAKPTFYERIMSFATRWSNHINNFFSQ